MNFPAKAVAKINKTHSLYLATLLFFATLIVYANTLGNGLFYDDEHFIYNNPQVINFSIPGFFTQSLTPPTGQPTNYYRPLLFLSFGIEYGIFKDAPFIYHLNNLLLHGAVGILLYIFILALFKNKSLAFLTALFFLISPVQTEAVSYANSRGDSLSLFFILLSLYFSLKKEAKYHLFSLLSFTCALLSKEIAITTPLLFVITHTFVQRFSFQGFLSALKKSIPFFLILFLYITLRLTIFNFSNTLNFWSYETLYTQNILVRLNTFLSTLPLYFSLLIFPSTLFMERDATIPIAETLTPLTLTAFLFFVFLFTLCWKIKNNYPIFLFSLLWFCISFGPMSGIIPINGIFYEHFLYIPSIGFYLTLSFCILWLLSKSKPFTSYFLFITLTIYLLFFSIRTINRNTEWNNPISFYTQTLNFAETARIYNNLAMTYADKKDFSKAIPLYKKSLNISDSYAETYYNLGNSYFELQKYSEAEKSYRKSLQINKWFIYPYIKLYSLYEKTGNKKAVTDISKTLEELGTQNKEYWYILKELQGIKN